MYGFLKDVIRKFQGFVARRPNLANTVKQGNGNEKVSPTFEGLIFLRFTFTARFINFTGSKEWRQLRSLDGIQGKK